MVPSKIGLESDPRPVTASDARPSITASVPIHGCSGRSDASSAFTLAVSGAVASMRPGSRPAASEKVASSVPARVERKRALAVSASSAKLPETSSARDAERKLRRVERRALGAVPVASFAADGERAGQARRRGDRPVAADFEARGEGQGRSRELGDPARGDAGERALRRDAAFLDEQARDVDVSVRDGHVRIRDRVTVARDAHLRWRAQRERVLAAVRERLDDAVPRLVDGAVRSPRLGECTRDRRRNIEVLAHRCELGAVIGEGAARVDLRALERALRQHELRR